jgi:hypothetical protein
MDAEPEAAVPAPPSEENQWPAVEAAFAFVIPSYQMLVSRFEAADGRLTTLLATAASLTGAAPVLGRAVRPDLSASSGWFVAGLALFAVIVVLGVAGRISGHLTLPDPQVHWNESLWRSASEFRRNAIYFAGRHFDLNAKAIDRKGCLTIWMAALLGAEIVAFAIWIAA